MKTTLTKAINMKWIHVYDQLPPEGESVLVWLIIEINGTEFTSPQVARWLTIPLGTGLNGQEWFDSKEHKLITDKGMFVTHWMPLPEAPPNQ